MSRFTGTGQLVRLALRRDRIRIPVWVLALSGITYATAVSEEGLFETQAAIDAYAALAERSPVTIAFAGPPIGLNTIEGIVVYEMSLMAILGVSVMAILMTSRHTRAEEESGRSELLRATEVGRHAGGAAALVTTALACLLVGVGLYVALLPTVMPRDAAAVFSAGMAALGLVYAGITLCLAQLFVHARTVTGTGLMVLAVGYVVRAAGDVREDWLIWLSPIGWVQAVHVPTENRWWPLAVPVVAVAVLLGLAVLLAERRDFGAGMVPVRDGRPTAPRSLSGTVGLAWRTQRTAVLGWSVSLFLLGTITGTLGSEMVDMVEENPALADYLAVLEGASVIDSYVATMALIFGLSVGAFAVWSAAHPGADEDGAQLDLLLATPVSRTRTMLGNLLVTVLGTLVVLVSSATGVGIAHALAMDDASEGWRAASAQLAYLPAILTLVGVAAVIYGWLPRWTWVAWLLLVYYFVLGWLGGLLDPPQWMMDASAFEQTPRLPVESLSGAALPIITVLALLLVAVGVAGFRRRDVAVA